MLLTGCGGPPAAKVSPPTPAADARSFCAKLDAVLPSRVDDRPMVKTIPSSPNSAAWGDPPVVLRCGVARPAGLRPTSEVIAVGPGRSHVSWFLRETGASFVFTTVNRVANVEVSVPTSVPRADATAPLVDLARSVIAAIPTQREFDEGP